jgi:hypothetical protein
MPNLRTKFLIVLFNPHSPDDAPILNALAIFWAKFNGLWGINRGSDGKPDG